MRILYLLLILTWNISCEEKKEIKSKKIKIVCTTNMIYDVVKNIAGDTVSASFLMGAGVDPHLYKTTQGDITTLLESDIVFYNGLFLEGKMEDVFEKLARQKPVIPVTKDINKKLLRTNSAFAHSFDPHVWFDIKLWKTAVKTISSYLQTFDTIHTNFYKTNEIAYLSQLDSLDVWAKKEINTIPPSQKILITAHDAFGYFGDAYNIQVMGLQGISTQSDFGLKDITYIVNEIVSKNVKAVFLETSVSEKSMKAVILGCKEKGHTLTIGGKLYSDAMGEINSPEGNYIGMFSFNVKTIVSSLK
ncbi:MAG: zinc ABC transporter substrate-binding protein [Chitinophagaceae bacterium]|nr:zinc ABC transporter substrate-binding protein [Chitinophagaceae bacterium]